MNAGTAAIDMIDHGFLRRLAGRLPESATPSADEAEGSDMRVVTGRSPRAGGPGSEHAVAEHPVQASAPPPHLFQPPDPGPGAPLVDRLLHAAPAAWEAVARRIEEAHREGATVIAVAGARRGEGRTTLVECLRRTLTARGGRVEVVARPPCEGPRDGGPIVLVDAGVWFPGGPLRRASLERASLGCHAAILVRRADQPECAARGTAIEAVGLQLLGEVLTMVPTVDG